MEIEQERARKRQATLNNIETISLVANLPQAIDGTGKSRDKAAAKVGYL